MSPNAVASTSALQATFDAQRAAFAQHPYPDSAERRHHLHALERAISSGRDRIAAALNTDFSGRSRQEAIFTEVFVSLGALRHARKHVASWMARRPRPLSWPLWPARAWIMPQPLGVAGIIVPWNYPVFTAIAPLAGALSAGNRVMLKMSEFTPAVAETVREIVASAGFPEHHIAVTTGDASAGREFSSLPFDHLLFTGSTAVGREVMRAAAQNLTPVTLELGGKSPAILALDANVSSAASDIAYGKLINAGQTCIAPDYVLVPEAHRDAFVAAVRAAIERYWPQPAANPQYTCIINDRHFERLSGYLDEARRHGAHLVEIGPATPPGSRRLPPTLVLDPPAALRLMQEEIFGPVLPVVSYASLDDAIAYVNARPRPLALYLFTKSSRIENEVLTRTVSGGASVNDTLVYIAAEDLPFGGVGPSGSGHYHGREGFDTFSKLKPVFRRRFPGLGRTLRPPYGRMHKILERILVG